MKYIAGPIPEVYSTQNSGKPNSSKRITSSDAGIQPLLLKLAEELAKQHELKNRLDILKNAASILRIMS